jgi:hypothetical protein
VTDWDSITSFTKSFERIVTTLLTEAPSTLQMPISFILLSADNTDKPNRPMHQIKMVKLPGPLSLFVVTMMVFPKTVIF